MNAKIITALSVVILAAGIFSQPASATRFKRHQIRSVDNCVMNNLGRQIAGEAATLAKTQTDSVAAPARKRAAARSYASANQDTTIIGGRPSGCPHAYCGCGLAKYLGLDDARLNLAWTWGRFFPRENAPRARRGAVSQSHV